MRSQARTGVSVLTTPLSLLGAGITLVIGMLALFPGTGTSEPSSATRVPRHGFLVGDYSGHLRILNRHGHPIRRVNGLFGRYGPQAIAIGRDRKHAFVSIERGDRLPALYQVNLASGAKRMIAHGISPILSPHGIRLAYLSVVRHNDIQYKDALVIRNLRTGDQRRVSLGSNIVYGTPPENIISWSLDGKRIAFDDHSIRQVRLESAHNPISDPLAPRGWTAPAFLDSQTLVALANCCIGRHQHMIGIDRAGRRHPFATLGAPPENLLRLRPGHLLAVTALYRLTLVSRHHTREVARGITAAAR